MQRYMTTRNLVAFAMFTSAAVYLVLSFVLDESIRAYLWTVSFIAVLAGMLVVQRKFPGIR